MPARKKPKNKDEAVRKCLGPNCGELFVSEWKGNRICPRCSVKIEFKGSINQEEVSVDLKGRVDG